MAKTALIFLMALAAHAQTATISDTLTTAVGGGNWTGRVTVTLNSPGSAQPLYSGTTSLAGWSATYCVGVTGSDCTATTAAGAFAATLYTNDAITPAGTSYSARYQPTRGPQWSETWTVSAGNTKLYQIRATTVPTPTTTFTAGQLALAAGRILYGNSSGVATSLAAGTNGQVLALSGGYPAWTTNITGNASTATALAANGTNCSAGQFPLGVDASGAAENCTALPTTITGTASEITASASTGAVTLSLPSSIDLGGKALEIPNSTSLPGTCTVGQIYMDTDATSGQRIYACESTNTWALQGGGGGATSISGLSDLLVSRTSSTVLNIAAGKARIGNVVTTFSAATATLSGTSATSTAYVYVSNSGVLTVGHNGAATVTCSGCTTATGVAAFPADSIPIATATYTSTAWDVSGITDLRALTSRVALSAGEGISISTGVSGANTVAVDASVVPRYSTGSGAPSANCTQGRDYYLDTTAGSLYQCTATNTWATVGSTGSSFSPSTFSIYEEFCGANNNTFSQTWSQGGVDLAYDYSSFDHPCVTNVSNTGANALAGLVLRYQSTNNASGFGFLGGWTTKTGQEFIFIFLSEETGQTKYRVGLTSAFTEAAPNDGIYAEYNNNSSCANTGSDTTWKYYTRASSVSSSATGPAFAAYTWYKVRIRSTVAGQWSFSVSTAGGAYSSEQTLSTNIPTAKLAPFFQVVACDANYARMFIDYFSASTTGVSR